MKIRLERDALAEAVTWTARALPARSPVPVLTGLLLEAEADGVLRLSSFDYEVSARVETATEVGDPGTVLVSGKLLADICRSLPAKPVDLVTDGSRVLLTCGSSKFTLLTMPVDDYPSLPVMPAGSGTIPGNVFAAAVAQVAVAASREESPPMLAGVKVEIDGDHLTLLATDRYRLAMRTVTWLPSVEGMQAAALIKAKTLTEVAKAISGGDVTLGLSADGQSGLIGFEAGGRRSTSLLMDGEYPRVRALFPSGSPITAVVDRGELIEATKRVGLVAERHTAVSFAFSADGLTLTAGQGEGAQASEVVTADVSGDDIKIGFNAQYVLDGLGAITSPSVRFAMTAGKKPAVITGQTPDGAEDDTFKYLLMPMRVDQ